MWVEVEEEAKLRTNFKCDFQKLTSIQVMKWTITLFTYDATKIGPGGFESCLIFRFFGCQLVRKNDITYYGFKYIFLNKQTFRLIKMINILGYKVTNYFGGITLSFLSILRTRLQILIFDLIFASDFKIIPFCRYCVSIKDKNGFLDNF